MGYRRAQAVQDRNLVWATYLNGEQEVRQQSGVPVGITFSQGKAAFAIANNKITFPTVHFGTEFSIRAIVTPDNVSGTKYIFSKAYSGNNGPALLYDNNVIRFYPNISNGNQVSAALTAIRVEIVATWDGSTAELYINTVPGAINGSPQAPDNFTKDIIIGLKYDDSGDFAGEMELVEIYNKALTSQEVNNLNSDARYVIPQLNTADHQVILNITARDGICRNLLSGDTIQGEVVDEVVLTDISIYKEGSIRSPLFNGSTSKVDAGDYSDLTGDITVLAWINPKTWGGLDSGRVCSNGKLEFGVIITLARLFARSDGSAIMYSANNSISLVEGYYFACITRTAAGLVNFYINGELNGSTDQDSGIPEAGSTNFIIGNNNAGDRTFDGPIPEVIVLNGLLTANEISQYYTATKARFSK